MSGNGTHKPAYKGKGKAPAVALPLVPRARVPSGESSSKGPSAPADGGSSSAAQPDPFHPAGLAARMSGITLSGDASKFEPSNVFVKHLLNDSTPDDAAPAPSSSAGGVIVTSTPAPPKETSPIGTRPSGYLPRRARFSTDVGSFTAARFVVIRKIEHLADYYDAVATFNEDFGCNLRQLLYDVKVSEPSNLCKTWTAWLAFDDLESAPAFLDIVNVVRGHWQCEYVSHSAYDAASGSRIYPGCSPALHYDGQVAFVIIKTGPVTAESFVELEDGMLELASHHGKVFACREEQTLSPDSDWTYRFELTRITDAHKLLKDITRMNPHHFSRFSVTTQPYCDNMRHATDDDDVPVLPAPTARVFTSPTGRTAWVTDNNGGSVAYPPHFTLPKVETRPYVTSAYDMNAGGSLGQHDPFVSASTAQAGPSNYANHAAANHAVAYRPPHLRADPGTQGLPQRGRQLDRRDDNIADTTEGSAVVLSRIINGQDVRTTLMLRNIPNSWTFRDMKSRIDQVAQDQYDFSYLRIDFEKSTNVGYGFINLISPAAAARFVQAIQGTEWAPGAHPRKNVQLSYATVQGIDCIIDKFRNSSIMSEFSDYRPKLWYLPCDAPRPDAVGTEKPFPPANNMTKNQRSHDNAGSIGLYWGRYKHNNHGDRARRSTFDRGTQHQMREEASYNNNYTFAPVQQQYMPQPLPGYYHTPMQVAQVPAYGHAPVAWPPMGHYYAAPQMPYGGQYTPLQAQGWAMPPQAYGAPYQMPHQVPRAFSGSYQQPPPAAGGLGTVDEAETEETEAGSR